MSLSSALEHVCTSFEKVDLLGHKYSSVFYRESPIDTEEVSKEPDNCKEAQTLYMEIQNKIHFIGIGGIGMSGVAAICINSGAQVSGSDIAENAQTRKLRELGAQITIGHSAENVAPGVSKVVVSTAISAENSEVMEARTREIPLYHRSDLLAELFIDAPRSLAVVGSHGKTTVSSIVSTVMVECDKDPTCLVGGHVSALNGNARTGNSGIFVAEADESDATFLKYFPHSAVITNIDNDHLDHYESLDSIVKAFEIFASHVDPDGTIYLCADDAIARNIAIPEGRRVITYGIDSPSTYMATDIKLLPYGSRFTLTIAGINRGHFDLNIPGKHNILNSLPAIAFAVDCGVEIDKVRVGLQRFRGAGRRFEVKGTWDGITVIDDYGHHPNEIRATLSAAKSLNANRVFVVFQPHRYTRTQLLSAEFGRCFDDCDRLFITDIYPASEKPIPGVSSKMILDQIPVAQRRKARLVKNLRDVPLRLLGSLQPGDVVFTLGAGDVTSLGPTILESIRLRSEEASRLAV